MLLTARHWGVAARVTCGVCVNILGFGHGAGSPKGFGETFGIDSLHPGLGGGVRAKVHPPPDPEGPSMEAFLVSTMVVGLAEIGDKTQILSLMLAARFQRPLPILFGILFATIANHAAAGLAGKYFGDLLSGAWLRWILGLSFLSVAVWALFPDKYEGNDRAIGRSGAFMSTLVAFFLAEIGDKTQIATIGLAARFEQFYPVVAGTTLGMMLANIPAVFLGDKLATTLPVKAIRFTAAIVFAVLGILTLTVA
jgi:Ca2+/H+ antiporter, TMEM165/GDT1 family